MRNVKILTLITGLMISSMGFASSQGGGGDKKKSRMDIFNHALFASQVSGIEKEKVRADFNRSFMDYLASKAKERLKTYTISIIGILKIKREIEKGRKIEKIFEETQAKYPDLKLEKKGIRIIHKPFFAMSQVILPILCNPKNWKDLPLSLDQFKLGNPLKPLDLFFDKVGNPNDHLRDFIARLGFLPDNFDLLVTEKDPIKEWHIDDKDASRGDLGDSWRNHKSIVSFMTYSEDETLGTKVIRVQKFDYHLVNRFFTELQKKEFSNFLDNLICDFLNQPENNEVISILEERTQTCQVYSGIANHFYHKSPKTVSERPVLRKHYIMNDYPTVLEREEAARKGTHVV